MDDLDKVAKLKEQAAIRIAKAIIAHMDEQMRDQYGDVYKVEPEAREKVLKHWAGLAVKVLDVALPQFTGDLDEAVKMAASVEGSWEALHDRVRTLWFENLGWPPPMLGPPANKTVDCDCKGEWADCPWCGGCGWLVPQMKKLLEDATRVEKKPSPEPEPEPSPGGGSFKGMSIQEMCSFQWPLIDHLHVLGATRVDITPRGGVRVDFPPRKDKAESSGVDVPEGRLCKSCIIPMKRSVAEGQVQWTCPDCRRVEAE